MRAAIFAMSVSVALTGCASSGSFDSAAAPGPHQSHADWVQDAIAGDGPGWRRPSKQPEAIQVSNLPKSRRGNPSEYTVAGIRYAVLDSAAGYKEKGHASWYGRKFHGRETSSGEVYDMYEMSAAHKHLPLPTFVRVTRVDTGDSIVVKVNDRGPFVPGRVIDLSYQAATTLGIVKAGTAEVLIEALSTHQPENTLTTAAATPIAVPEPVPAPVPVVKKSASGPGHYLQLGAFREALNAQNLVGELANALPTPIVIDHDESQSLFRVWVGPLQTIADRDTTVAALVAQGVTQYTMVTLQH